MSLPQYTCTTVNTECHVLCYWRRFQSLCSSSWWVPPTWYLCQPFCHCLCLHLHYQKNPNPEKKARSVINNNPNYDSWYTL